MVDFFDNPTFIKIIDLFIGVFGLLAILYRRKPSPDDISKKDLLKTIKEQEREIERLRIERHAWQIRHEHMKKKHNDHDLQY